LTSSPRRRRRRERPFASRSRGSSMRWAHRQLRRRGRLIGGSGRRRAPGGAPPERRRGGAHAADRSRPGPAPGELRAASCEARGRIVGGPCRTLALTSTRLRHAQTRCPPGNFLLISVSARRVSRTQWQRQLNPARSDSLKRDAATAEPVRACSCSRRRLRLGGRWRDQRREARGRRQAPGARRTLGSVPELHVGALNTYCGP